jgi:hypothetical protein
MARNLLIIAKLLPGIDTHVDAIISSLQNVRDLFGLVSNSQSGRALLYWACWYDPWLMGDDLDPEDWRWALSAKPVINGIWRLSLTEGNWKAIQSDASHETHFEEQHWLCWQLSSAFESHRAQNDKAHLYFGRDVMGASLGDDEVTARAI